MEPTAEREALRALVDSEGWALFVKHIDDNWGAEAVCRRTDELYQREDTEGRDLEHERRALALTTRTIQALARWPKDRILQLAPAKSLNPFAAKRRA